MITNKGKSVISKYLIGQTQAYASYIAIGCGATPLKPGDTIDINALSTKTELEYETLRVPITSRGYVTEDGVSKLVLTAQIPAEGRYGITEVGIYPAVSNPVAVNNDSRSLLNFQTSEQWIYKNSGGSQVVPELAIPESLTIPGDIKTISNPFFTTSFDNILINQTRVLNNEIPRNGTYSLIAPGNMTTFTGNNPTGGTYLVLANPGIDLSNSAPNDKLKVAFSILSNTISDPVSGSIKMIVEFGSSDTFGTGSYARSVFDVSITDAVSGPKRYFVKQIAVKDLETSSAFSWSSATYVKIGLYTSSNVTVALDGMRIDNVSSLSPVYGLVGYTVIKNSLFVSTGTEESVPVVKDKDKTSFIEFRFQASVI